MSVFTPVSEADARALLAHYALGELERLEGIAQGVENTNYFLTTTTGEYVLTLFEHIPRADLPFYVGLMDHLSRRGVACPQPMRRENGEMLSDVNAKPACIVTRLPGEPRMHPDAHDCREAGAILGRLHAAGIDYDAGLDNWRGREWRESFAVSVAPRLSAHENALIASENRYQAAIDDSTLPQGIIHGDLFRDNVLWDDAGEGGVIDFYFACDDVLVYDLAIAVNDWCVGRNADDAPDSERMRAMVRAYHDARPLTDDERAQWHALLRAAALRFWVSRLYDLHLPRPGELTHAHDPVPFERLLRARASAPARPLDV
jgi:homoserine kinase type II